MDGMMPESPNLVQQPETIIGFGHLRADGSITKD